MPAVEISIRQQTDGHKSYISIDVKSEVSGSKKIMIKEAPLLGISRYKEKEYLIEVEGKNWLAPGIGVVQTYDKIYAYDAEGENLQGSLTIIQKLEELE